MNIGSTAQQARIKLWCRLPQGGCQACSQGAALMVHAVSLHSATGSDPSVQQGQMLRQDSLQTPCTHMHKQSKAVSQELQKSVTKMGLHSADCTVQSDRMPVQQQAHCGALLVTCCLAQSCCSKQLCT